MDKVYSPMTIVKALARLRCDIVGYATTAQMHQAFLGKSLKNDFNEI